MSLTKNQILALFKKDGVAVFGHEAGDIIIFVKVEKRALGDVSECWDGEHGFGTIGVTFEDFKRVFLSNVSLNEAGRFNPIFNSVSETYAFPILPTEFLSIAAQKRCLSSEDVLDELAEGWSQVGPKFGGKLQ